MPTATPIRPAASWVRPLTAAGMRRASRAVTTEVADHANSRIAAPSASMPSAVPTNPARYDIRAMIPPPVARAATVAARNGGCRNNMRSSIGLALRNSSATKASSSSAARTNNTIGVTAVHPCRPSTSAASSAPMPVANSTAPTGSRPRGASDMDSSTRSCATTASTRVAIARTTYASRQLAHRSRSAASSGPSAIPAPTLAPQTPLALARTGPAG